jgi:hypothetical protein
MAREILAFLNADLAELRNRVWELEVNSELKKNELLRQEGKTDKRKENEWKLSDAYKLWRTERNRLQDFRVWRRALEKHSDLLEEQEKYMLSKQGYRRVIE